MEHCVVGPVTDLTIHLLLTHDPLPVPTLIQPVPAGGALGAPLGGLYPVATLYGGESKEAGAGAHLIRGPVYLLLPKGPLIEVDLITVWARAYILHGLLEGGLLGSLVGKGLAPGTESSHSVDTIKGGRSRTVSCTMIGGRATTTF